MIGTDLTASQARALELYWEANSQKYPYVENFRMATKGDAVETDAYNADRDELDRADAVDVELACDDGSTLLYGFHVIVSEWGPAYGDSHGPASPA